MAKDWTDNVLERWAVIRPGPELEVYQVTARISRIAQHIGRRQSDVFSRFGLNRGEVGLLSALRIAGPPYQASPSRLLKGLMLSSAGITSRIDRLESRGLVKRVPDATDRRGVLVELTESGRELLDEAVAANTASELSLVGRMTPEQVARLGRLLREMLSNLEPAILE